LTFLIKKRNAFTQLGFPNVKTSEVFYILLITKQTQIQKFGKLLLWWNRGRRDAMTHYEEPVPAERLLHRELVQYTGNWFCIRKGLCTQDHGTSLGDSEPCVLGSGAHFRQARSQGWMENCVVGWNDSVGTRKGGECACLTLSL